jgi:predicted metal-binding protein
MTRDLDRLIFDLRALHDDIRLISAELIAVAEWVRWRYGCRAYGKHFCCPPFVPDPEDTRKLLAGYRHALLVRMMVPPARDAGRDQARGRVHDHKTRLQRLVYEIAEKGLPFGIS